MCLLPSPIHCLFLLLLTPSLMNASGQLRFQLSLPQSNGVQSKDPLRAEICAREFRWRDPSHEEWAPKDCKFGHAQLQLPGTGQTASSSSLMLAFNQSWRQSFVFTLRLWHGNDLLLHRTERVFLLPAGSGWRSISSEFNRPMAGAHAHERLEVRFRVDCAPNFYGPGCDVRCELTELERKQGRVECAAEDGRKRCRDGWHGDGCAQSTATSSNDSTTTECPCQNGGRCAEDGQRCLCPPGYRGTHCELCATSGRCRGFCQRPGECACPEGKGGQFCEKDLVYCQRHSPCQNGGTCLNTPDGNYSCQCTPGFGGHDCERRLSSCEEAPCLNGAQCVTTSTGFRCDCPPNFFGRFCQVRATRGCADLPCQNGGSCADLAMLMPTPLLQRERTTNASASFKCLCTEHWTGAVCDQPWDSCAATANPCQNGASCIVDPLNPDGFHCQCPLGWEGPLCATSVEDCKPNPCLNGGTCLDGHNAFRCICPSGFGGELCQEPGQIGRHESTTKAAQNNCPHCSPPHPSSEIPLASLILPLLALITLMALLAVLCLLQRVLPIQMPQFGRISTGFAASNEQPQIAVITEPKRHFPPMPAKSGKCEEERYVLEPTCRPGKRASAYVEAARMERMKTTASNGWEAESGIYEEIGPFSVQQRF